MTLFYLKTVFIISLITCIVGLSSVNADKIYTSGECKNAGSSNFYLSDITDDSDQDTAVRVVSLHSAEDIDLRYAFSGFTELHIDSPKKPIVLILGSTRAIHWLISGSEGTVLNGIFIAGEKSINSSVSGPLVVNVPVYRKDWPTGYQYPGGTSAEMVKAINEDSDIQPLKISSFSGCYMSPLVRLTDKEWIDPATTPTYLKIVLFTGGSILFIVFIFLVVSTRKAQSLSRHTKTSRVYLEPYDGEDDEQDQLTLSSGL